MCIIKNIFEATEGEIEEAKNALSQKGPCKRCGSNEWGFHRTKNTLGRHCKFCRTNRYKLYQQRLSKNGGSHTRKEWQELKQKYENCPFCLRKWSDIPLRLCKRNLGVITKEHVIPVSKGGKNTIDNIMPCCYQCNSSGGGKLHKNNISQ
jgi:hypothetical protein